MKTNSKPNNKEVYRLSQFFTPASRLRSTESAARARLPSLPSASLDLERKGQTVPQLFGAGAQGRGPGTRGSIAATTASPSLSVKSCDIWYPACYVIMMAVGFYKDLHGSVRSRDSDFTGILIKLKLSYLVPVCISLPLQRFQRDPLSSFSPKSLQLQKNTHRNKVGKFQLYYSSKIRVTRSNKISHILIQPRSQALSSPGGGGREMKEPGNEVDPYKIQRLSLWRNTLGIKCHLPRLISLGWRRVTAGRSQIFPP